MIFCSSGGLVAEGASSPRVTSVAQKKRTEMEDLGVSRGKEEQIHKGTETLRGLA